MKKKIMKINKVDFNIKEDIPKIILMRKKIMIK